MLHNILKIVKKIVSPNNDPGFIIAGVQKSGTTSLYQYLNQHPKLRGSEPKELHYFNRDYYFDKSISDYRSHFTGNRNLIYFEATPAYLYHPGAMENLKRYYPNIKLVILLRNPITRAFSAWHHYRDLFYKNKGENLKFRPKRKGNSLYNLFFANRELFPSFRECLDIEVKLMNNQNPPFEPGLIRRGFYFDQIKKCYSLFPKKNMYITGFNSFIKDPEKIILELCEFLGIPPIKNIKFPFKPFNKRKYIEKIPCEDERFLSTVYYGPNRELSNLIGSIDW
jgi:hypothetical protein